TDCVSDYVIPSYTTTLTALLDPPTHTTTTFKMTALIQLETVGCSYLPATRDELTKIEERVPKQWLTSLGHTSETSVDTALFNLQQSAIVHFAGHGTQDVMNPHDSGLILSNGQLKVSQIMHLPEESQDATLELSRKGMSLALLSACKTADEAMHLAATLLFAGFRGVVGTMWTITDHVGPKVADAFYEYLFRNCDCTSDPPITPNLTEVTCALHLAVTKL
ncbi:CHAT domain-containing protein, partial [Mycena sp. CBHHK59/15]